MDNIIFSTLIAFLVTFFTIPVIIKIAKEKHLFDEPDERKIHDSVIPTMGGLGIFAGFILACLIGVQFGVDPNFQYFIAAFLIMFFIGIKDDILVISPYKKFIAQIIATSLVIYFGHIELSNMFGFLGINTIHPAASFILTLVAIIGITNAINLIDGVDGLAGSVSLVISLILGFYFLSIKDISYASMSFGLAGAIGGFLIYNFSPAKIFMGDTGSLLLGMALSILTIKFINVEGTNSYFMPSHAAPAVGFALLMVPIFDTLRVFSRRIVNRKSPFSPDRTHLHHYLLDLGFNHRKIAISCALATIFFVGVAFLLRNYNSVFIIATLFSIALALTGWIIYVRKAKMLNNPPVEKKKFVNVAPKVVSIAKDPKMVEAID